MEAAVAVQEVSFHGDVVLYGQEYDGEVMVPLKRLCENLGIDYKGQFTKVRQDASFNYGDITIVAPDGKKRKMVCLPLDQVSGWLFTINVNKVRPDLRDKLITYKRECVRVLDQHFRKTMETKLLESQNAVLTLAAENHNRAEMNRELVAEINSLRSKVSRQTREINRLKAVSISGPQVFDLDDPVLVDYRELSRIFKFAQAAGLDYPTSWLHDLLDKNSGVPSFKLTVKLPGAISEIPMLTVAGKCHPKLL